MFVFSEFVLYKGTNFYHVTQAEARETFFNLRNDLLGLSYAAYFAELADAVSVEELPTERLFLLLAKALYYLSTKEVPAGIINVAYQLKLMDISGFRPSLGRCVNCHKVHEEYERFSPALGGVLCSDCAAADKASYRLSRGTLETFKIFLNTEISRLNNVKIDNTIYNEMDKITKDFIRKHLGLSRFRMGRLLVMGSN
jgi:DNA repair protein RecO (recombination protein O)